MKVVPGWVSVGTALGCAEILGGGSDEHRSYKNVRTVTDHDRNKAYTCFSNLGVPPNHPI